MAARRVARGTRLVVVGLAAAAALAAIASAGRSTAASASPANSAAPVIGGVLVEGATLAAHPGTWVPNESAYQYRWYRCDADQLDRCVVPLTSASTYTLTAHDVEKWLRVDVTATGAGGSAVASSALVGPVAANGLTVSLTLTRIAAPVISGQVREGDVLDASAGLWYGPPDTAFWYQWRRCREGCEDIPGAVASYYVPTRVDVGSHLTVAVTALAPASQLSLLATAAAALTPNVIDRCPDCGAPAQCEDGIDNDGDGKIDYPRDPGCYGYQDPYELDNDPVGPQCNNGRDDDGDQFTDFPDDPGCSDLNDDDERDPVQPTGAAPQNTTPPTIYGVTENGQTLTATTGNWTGSPNAYSYVWGSCHVGGDNCAIDWTATSSTYTLSDSDVDRYVMVQVTAANEFGATPIRSAPTAPASGPVSDGRPGPQVEHSNFGYRYLKYGTYSNGAPYCCGGDRLWGTRANLRTPGGRWIIPNGEFGFMRIGAGGSYPDNPEGVPLSSVLTQGGFLKTNGLGVGFNNGMECSPSAITPAVERFWVSATSPEPTVHSECQLIGAAIEPYAYATTISVVNKNGQDDWGIYMDQTQVFNNDNSMRSATEILAGGEFSRINADPSIGCMGSSYGLQTPLWTRFRAPGATDPYTIASSFIRNEKKGKWQIGNVSGSGFNVGARGDC